MPITKARQLAEFIANADVDSDEIATGAVTTSKLADTLDFSSKTMVMADNQLSGDKIHGGTVSAFASTGIDDNASATAVTILSDGKVGIGTTVPDGKLTVALENSNTPAFRLSSPTSGTDFAISSYNDANGTYVSMGVNHLFDVSGNDAVMDTNDKSAAIVLDGRNNGRIQFLTNSSGIATPRMNILQDGKVGIGYTSPNEKLHVNGHIEASAGYKLASHPVLDYTSFDGGYSTRLGSTGTSTLNATQIFAGGSVQATFKGGNVGIGTTSPASALEVSTNNGNAEIEALRLTNNDDTFSNNETEQAISLGFGLPAYEGGTRDNRLAAKIVGRKGGEGTNDWYTTGASTNFNGQLDFYTRQDDTLTRQMILSEDGNVGIGTASPVDKLHIYGNEGNSTMGIVLQDDGWGAPNGQYKLTVRNSDGAFAIRKNTSNNFDFATSDDHLVLTSSSGKGKLGINRDTNLDSTVTIEQATDGTDGGIRIYGSNSNSIRGQMYYDGTQSFVIHGTSGPSGEHSTLRFATGVYNNPQIRMSINKDNGNVGIGTTSPSEKLHVAGVIRSEGYDTDSITSYNITGSYSAGTEYVFTTRSQLNGLGYGNGFYKFLVWSDTFHAGTSHYQCYTPYDEFYFNNYGSNTSTVQTMDYGVSMGHAPNTGTRAIDIRLRHKYGADATYPANQTFTFIPVNGFTGLTGNTGYHLRIYLFKVA